MATESTQAEVRAEEPQVEQLDCSQTLPLVDYVRSLENDPDACVPCDLSVIAPWYRDELTEKGYPELAAEVDALVESELGDLHTAETLDRVRAEVTDDATRERLEHFDCLMQQSHDEPEAEATQGESAEGLDTDGADVEE